MPNNIINYLGLTEFEKVELLNFVIKNADNKTGAGHEGCDTIEQHQLSELGHREDDKRYSTDELDSVPQHRDAKHVLQHHPDK